MFLWHFKWLMIHFSYVGDKGLQEKKKGLLNPEEFPKASLQFISIHIINSSHSTLNRSLAVRKERSERMQGYLHSSLYSDANLLCDCGLLTFLVLRFFEPDTSVTCKFYIT